MRPALPLSFFCLLFSNSVAEDMQCVPWVTTRRWPLHVLNVRERLRSTSQKLSSIKPRTTHLEIAKFHPPPRPRRRRRRSLIWNEVYQSLAFDVRRGSSMEGMSAEGSRSDFCSLVQPKGFNFHMRPPTLRGSGALANEVQPADLSTYQGLVQLEKALPPSTFKVLG